MELGQTAERRLTAQPGRRDEPLTAPASPEEVVAAYARTVYAIALAKMHTREDAEDVFQEVFLSYVRKKPVFTNERQGRVWFSKATVYACKMLWRTKKRHETLPMEAAENLCLQSQEDLELMVELQALPKKHREVLELTYFGGLSAGETAKVLGCSPNAVRVRLTRARVALGQRLR